MQPGLQASIEALIARRTGRTVDIKRRDAVGGGSIHQAAILHLADGESFFAKWSSSAPPGIFHRERESLEALKAIGPIRVPKPLGVGDEGPIPFLLLEHIQSTAPGKSFSATFGRRFAELHRRGTGQRFGFAHDNHLGRTPQPNGWEEDWPSFWRRHRLGHQLRLVRQQGLSTRELERLGESLMARLDDLLAEPAEPPTLLHGDLWGGNYLVDEVGEPVLIDPACYYGRREADLAMTYLFGGFDSRFHAAYQEAWPLAPGAAERLEIYKLYHLLNHLNLFGGGYLASCLAILRRFA